MDIKKCDLCHEVVEHNYKGIIVEYDDVDGIKHSAYLDVCDDCFDKKFNMVD